MEQLTTVDTYDTIVKRIIDEFDYRFHSILSLHNLLQTIESLPTYEKTTHEFHISALRTIVNSYGTENKRLTDFKANEVICALKSSLGAPSNTSSDLFVAMIDEFTREFSKYTTISSVRNIIVKLAALPTEIKQRHLDHYNSVTGVIISYGNVDKPLTFHQSTKLMRILNGEDDKKPPKSPNVYTKICNTNICDVLEQNTNSFPVYIPGHGENNSKLSQDDLLYEIMCSLQQELMSSVGSGITMHIVNFFESCELILENESSKYDRIMKDIKNHFEQCGWKLKNETSAGGFQTAPNSTKIINGIVRIMDAYF